MHFQVLSLSLSIYIYVCVKTVASFCNRVQDTNLLDQPRCSVFHPAALQLQLFVQGLFRCRNSKLRSPQCCKKLDLQHTHQFLEHSRRKKKGGGEGFAITSLTVKQCPHPQESRW